MLILNRKPGQTIHIGKGIILRVLSITATQVEIGIEAPKEVPVLRGELLDSVLFVAIAFAGLYPTSVLIVMAFSNYLFKTTIEVVFTPITYAVVGFVKKHEKIDAYDYGERYNPLPTD